MKFWQLTSLLRERLYSIIELARTKSEWVHFAQWVDRQPRLIASQDREKLDAELPDDLVRAVLSSVDMPFRVDLVGWVRTASRSDTKYECLSAFEAFDHFGGEVLEDAVEKGVSHSKLFRKQYPAADQ